MVYTARPLAGEEEQEDEEEEKEKEKEEEEEEEEGGRHFSCWWGKKANLTNETQVHGMKENYQCRKMSKYNKTWHEICLKKKHEEEKDDEEVEEGEEEEKQQQAKEKEERE
ncbi:hypothetical protein E2C01_032879 [Portunus trituberculatus]|uniref:Uncharacterized protein n=1 Tax=Portunus trituberculatus TaxID=210409 RepID=A0A5B7F0X2_PORTR|nr:hypothetical protein [Portunus trituberculatus]